MKELKTVGLTLLALLLIIALSFLVVICIDKVEGQQQIIRGGGSGSGGTNSYTGLYNSLNTNNLGTNFSWNPLNGRLQLQGSSLFIYDSLGNINIILGTTNT